MSIFGIGARYGSTWMVKEFLNAGVAAIGFTESGAPEIYAQMRTIKIGDIIFMKAFGPSSSNICVMGAGIVTDNDVIRISEEIGHGIKVNWVFKEEYDLPKKLGFDKHRNVRCGTLYEEFNREISQTIIDMVINPDEYDDE